MFPQVEDARRILVPAVNLDLQTQWAEAKDRQIQAGKQRRQGDADDNAKPNPDARDVRHGTSSCKVSELPSAQNWQGAQTHVAHRPFLIGFAPRTNSGARRPAEGCHFTTI